jgi:GNAT superfamily N-acetyltransferase
VIRIFPQADLSCELAAQIAELERDAWPTGNEASRTLHDPALAPEFMVLVEGEQVLASLALLHKQVQHVGRQFHGVGLSAVTTRALVRGRGYGHRLIADAREHLAASAVDFGIFTCDRPLRAFYERAGWRQLPGTVLVGGTRAAPFRSDRPEFDKVTMGDFFSAGARAVRASFVRADVEIYPGEIDRLW